MREYVLKLLWYNENMSSIYDLDIKGIRKALRNFSKTIYGRTVFFLAYFIPFLAFLAIIGFAIALLIQPNSATLYAFYIACAVFFISFIVGNAYYYRELREYINGK